MTNEHIKEFPNKDNMYLESVRTDSFRAAVGAAAMLDHCLYEMLHHFDDGDPLHPLREVLDNAKDAHKRWNKFCDTNE